MPPNTSPRKGFPLLFRTDGLRPYVIPPGGRGARSNHVGASAGSAAFDSDHGDSAGRQMPARAP
jgi:hypothetical protein